MCVRENGQFDVVFDSDGKTETLSPHAHRYEVRHLKQHNALLTLRLVVHARAGMKETCYLLEVEDSTDLYTVQRKARNRIF